MSEPSWGERARNTFPGGVNSPVRAFRSVGIEPFFVHRAVGSRLEAEDGRIFVDWIGSWGPLILGHAEPSVIEAVTEAAARGTSYGAATEGEVRLAAVGDVPPVPFVDQRRHIVLRRFPKKTRVDPAGLADGVDRGPLERHHAVRVAR